MVETTRLFRGLDRLTLVLGLPLLAALFLPTFTLRANRIAMAEPRSLAQTLGMPAALVIAGAVLLLLLALFRWRQPGRRLALLGLALPSLLLLVGRGATLLLDGAPAAARVAPAAGPWLALAALVLLVADALARSEVGSALRGVLLAGAVAGMALLIASGLFADLSIAAELRGRLGAFRQASIDHLILAFGSFAAALLVGLPAGVALHGRVRLRAPVLDALTLIQTIPSIALFGMLILPLAWVAAHVPLASRAGVSGIGMAPALVALFLYSLLPIVSNTLAGLDGVPAAVSEAATGMGMTGGQRLRQVGLPLAMPVILAGARIVLVQNIGLAAVGALIGSGGYGVFIFQGIGQTAADLILLGVLPIVALAFFTSASLDLLIALQKRGRA